MSNPIIKPIQKIVSMFPPTWPFRIYNILLSVPFLRRLMSILLLRLTPKSIDIPEGRVIFDRDDPAMASSIGLGNYEPEMSSLFRSHLKGGMTVVDIGANLGYFTVIAAHRVGDTGRVFSFEPDPHNFDLLNKNITINGFKNVTALPRALSDRSAVRELFFGDNNTTHSFSDKRGRGRSESVVTETLDNSLKSFGSPKVDMIKMDIEGAEPLALEGMIETVSNNPNMVMFFEFHPNAIKRLDLSPLKFLERIKELGFSILVIDEDKRTHAAIDDLEVFDGSFEGKEISRNLLAIKKS